MDIFSDGSLFSEAGAGDKILKQMTCLQVLKSRNKLNAKAAS